jgi:iron(III) transport system ATP-binding protein
MLMTASPADEALTAPLSLEGVGFDIAGETILSAVTLAVRPREIVCLLGPSGCGKTTLLRIAAGIERQTRGVVRIAGTVVADARHFIPAEARDLGLVFQDLALFPHMRIAENVGYGLRGRRGAAGDVAAALAQVGLEGYGRAYPHQLSGGEQQRVALVRALLPAPRVVLFDEPFSGLDRTLREAVREDTLALLRGRAATAVIVTHDPEEALAIADRIALMRDGTIVQAAPPEEIWRWPVDLAAARVFSVVNAFGGRVERGGLATPLGRVPIAAEREGELVTVGFRPEALKVLPEDQKVGVEARVVRRRFHGSHVELTAAAGDVLVTLCADPYLVPHGEVVRVVPDLRQAMVLPYQV